ncbi:MAG TPA: AMP-binding protein [Caulobacteraceae bacterium]|nr:AMP-binding protein [Caulobacteraceae bacterium]
MNNPLFEALFATGAAGATALEAEDRGYSYAELDQETARYANALSELDVQPGDRVAVQAAKSTANLIAYLAIVRAGAAIVPLNTAYTLAELDYFIADAEPSLIIVDPERDPGIAARAPRVRIATPATLSALARGASPAFETAPRAESDLAALCYTSGTTGRSKGAMLTHGALTANARALVAAWRFTPADILIHALPIFHVHGLFIATHVPLMAGASILLQPRFDAGAVIAAMDRASVLMGVPTFYVRLLAQEGLTREAAAGMRLFVSGSAPLLASTHEAFAARTGKAILERYGMSETLMNTSNPYAGRRVAGSVGSPLPGVELRVVDDAGNLAPAGVAGAVEIKGGNGFGGYWRAPDKTRAAFTADGWFRTGDVGHLDAEGYLHLAGRASDLIISGGLNVYPAEVEAAIDAVSGVIESAVIGLPNADLGEAVTAVVVAEEGEGRPSEARIVTEISERLAAFKRPKRVIFVDALPRNAMGKVEKARLRRTCAPGN